MNKMTAAQHEAISAHCVEASNGYYDQHVWDAMMHHDGAGFLARQAEAKAAKPAPKPSRARRGNSDPLGFFAAIHATRR